MTETASAVDLSEQPSSETDDSVAKTPEVHTQGRQDPPTCSEPARGPPWNARRRFVRTCNRIDLADPGVARPRAALRRQGSLVQAARVTPAAP